MTDILNTALAADAAGISVWPTREDGTKAPEGAWKKWTQQRPSKEQLRALFSNGRTGVGAICGKVSGGGLECLEFEGRAVTDGLHVRFSELCEAAGLGDLLNTIQSGYTENTPSGGLHLLYRVPTPQRNTKLARRPGVKTSSVEVLVETRGEGGFVIIAPTHGNVHPSGLPWTMERGGIATITTITDEERETRDSGGNGLYGKPPKMLNKPRRRPRIHVGHLRHLRGAVATFQESQSPPRRLTRPQRTQAARTRRA